MRNTYDATVVIATRNRCEELRVALRSCVLQEPSVEILVMDDASDDGTVAMVRSEFPSVRVVTSERRCGQSEQRTRALDLITTEFMVSVDDDTEFTRSDIIAYTLSEFTRPEIAIVAMPFVNVNSGNEVFHRAPARDGIFVGRSFVAAAFAARTEVFRRLGGYREILLHRHEEEDLAIRLLDCGYVIRLGNAPPVHHFVSPRRDREEIVLLDHRNVVLFAWFNLPLRCLPREVASYALRAVRSCRKGDYGLLPIKGFMRGLVDAVKYRSFRRAVRSETVRLAHELHRRGGAMELREFRALRDGKGARVHESRARTRPDRARADGKGH